MPRRTPRKPSIYAPFTLPPMASCPRCGRAHGALQASCMPLPFEDASGRVWKFFATCPVMGHPIMVLDRSAANGGGIA